MRDQDRIDEKKNGMYTPREIQHLIIRIQCQRSVTEGRSADYIPLDTWLSI